MFLALILIRLILFSLDADFIVIQTRVLPNRKQFTLFLPARTFLPMSSREHVPFWEGPAPEDGTPRVSGAHVARRAQRAAPRPRSTPPTNTRSCVSRCHKSRGDPISRTGFQCGQFIVREGAQCPVIKHTSLYAGCIVSVRRVVLDNCPCKIVLVTLVAPRGVTDQNLS